ncbi:anhydro-N-acetylmuramic acid kinase [Microbispora sp. H10949]|uniref:anhydro-N-acetylmuramic acid kinase n=1 Tax=Microbispora sp. H10949 TaxID=2729111 RepID=UPI002872E404|nr:anhydro-N-acetylmuramic acid kinase [Microbispora sp. H10949]
MRVLGLISGTSHDGIDTALVDWALTGDVLTGVVEGVVEHTGTTPYAPEARAAILAALPPHTTDMGAVCRLDTLVGRAFAEAAAGCPPADLVCSHGQTLYHWVEDGRVRGTLQLGKVAWIAERLGVPVVSDLRARDVAAGGQGAPLVSAFDLPLLAGLAESPEQGEPGESHEPDGRSGPVGRLGALNLGGIANLTVAAGVSRHDHAENQTGSSAENHAVSRDADDAEDRAANHAGNHAVSRDADHAEDSTGWALAYDTGPASALMDAAVLAATGRPYDEDGRLAAAGRVHDGLLAELLAEPYYHRPPPKTTGKELFHAGYLDRVAGPYGLGLPDLTATLAALTAETVAAEIRRHRLGTVVVSGGGTRNPVLMRELRVRSGGVRLLPSDRLGVPPDAKEAVAFSYLGWLTAHGLPGTVPACTGASGPRVLGSLTPGRGPLRLPAPLAAPPRIIRMRTGGRRPTR